jgi:hypothetical protein
MYLNFKKNLIKTTFLISGGFLFLIVGYFGIKKISLIKNLNNKKNLITSKKIIQLLNKIVLKDETSLNDTDKFIINLVNEYTFLKSFKSNMPIKIRKRLFCNGQYINLIPIKNYKMTYISINLPGKIPEKIPIINYFISNDKLILYEKYPTVTTCNKNINSLNSSMPIPTILNKEINKLNLNQKKELYKKLHTIYIMWESLEELEKDKEFQEFIDEYIDIIEEDIKTES